MPARYIVFDGNQERPLKETGWHDCILSVDMEWISLTALWTCARDLGYDPVLIFACAAGKTALEIEVDGQDRGAFSYFATKTLRNAPNTTYRELVARVNDCFRSIRLEQRCEVMGRRSLLHRPFLSSDFTIISDACRSRSGVTKHEMYPVTLLEASGSQGQVSTREQLRSIVHLFGKSDCKVFTFSGHGRQLFIRSPGR